MWEPGKCLALPALPDAGVRGTVLRRADSSCLMDSQCAGSGHRRADCDGGGRFCHLPFYTAAPWHMYTADPCPGSGNPLEKHSVVERLRME